MVGHDFLAFYTAGTFVNAGRSHDLYDLELVNAFQHDLARRENLEIGQSFGPFWNPPFYAWVFAPLAHLPYHDALLIWETVNVACLVAAVLLLTRMLRPAPRSVTALVPLLVVISMPFIQAMTHGQNTMVSLLLLTVVVTLWRKGQAMPAGVAVGLLLYKPQLGAIVAAAVVVTMGWRAAVGLAITAGLLLAATVLTVPGTIADYLAKMPGNLHQFQVVQVYLWDRHVTLRAFWRLLLQGRDAGEMSLAARLCWLASSAVVAGLLARTWWRTRGGPRNDAFMAAVIVAMPLLMPFYFDYDLLLLAVSAVLYAGVRLRAEHRPMTIDRITTVTWVAFFFWLMLNSTVARYTRVNGSVVLLSAVTALLADRAVRLQAQAARTDSTDEFADQPLAAAA